jgi:hypothetical protein
MATTIKVNESTKWELDGFREYKNETYDEVIGKLVYVAKKAEKEPKLSQQTVKDIRKARERIKKGIYITEINARKRLRI